MSWRICRGVMGLGEEALEDIYVGEGVVGASEPVVEASGGAVSA